MDGLVPLPTASGRSIVAVLWRLLAGRRLALVGVLALFVAQAATGLVVPLVVGAVVDSVVDGDAGRAVPIGALVVVCAALAGGLLTWRSAAGLAAVLEPVICDLREAFVAAALDLPSRRLEGAGSGDVVSRATDDVAHLSETLPGVLPGVVGAVCTTVLVAFGLGALDPRYLAGLLVVVPLGALTGRWYLAMAPGVYGAERAAVAERGRHVLDTLHHLPTVTAHGLAERQLGRVRDASWTAVRCAVRTRIVQNALFGRLSLAELGALVVVLLVGAVVAAGGGSSVGAVTAAVMLMLRVVAPVQELLLVADEVQAAVASLGRVVGLIGHHDDVPAAVRPASAGALVELSGVGYSYVPGHEVLVDVGLALRAGESVAVVGASGSGKSTLAGVVAGELVPDRGVVSAGVGASRVVTVTQENHLFAGSLRDNLLLVAPDADDRRVLAAFEALGARALVAGLPDGLDTLVGAGGLPLSPAAAQLVALVRAELAGLEIVVLDEATAEADSADAGVLDRAASAVIRGRAALVVAHRLTQAATCDRVVVLHEGRIVEQGSHVDLVAAGGTYARLWAAWNGEGVRGA